MSRLAHPAHYAALTLALTATLLAPSRLRAEESKKVFVVLGTTQEGNTIAEEIPLPAGIDQPSAAFGRELFHALLSKVGTDYEDFGVVTQQLTSSRFRAVGFTWADLAEDAYPAHASHTAYGAKIAPVHQILSTEFVDRNASRPAGSRFSGIQITSKNSEHWLTSMTRGYRMAMTVVKDHGRNSEEVTLEGPCQGTIEMFLAIASAASIAEGSGTANEAVKEYVKKMADEDACRSLDDPVVTRFVGEIPGWDLATGYITNDWKGQEQMNRILPKLQAIKSQVAAAQAGGGVLGLGE